MARGHRAGENPARWRVISINCYRRAPRCATLLRTIGLPGGVAEAGIAARALEFTILTVARTGESVGARWDEINWTDKIWIIAGTRMKAGREHRVPLCDRALAILREMRPASDGVNVGEQFVFSGGRAGRSLSNMAFLMLLRRMGRGDLTVHGFRSSFRDWAAERTNFPAEVAEMALAHTVSDKVEAAYRRGDLFDKRRRLMTAWAEFCSKPQTGGAVAALHART
jgi:integrase